MTYGFGNAALEATFAQHRSNVSNASVRKEAARLVRDSTTRKRNVMVVDFVSNAVSSTCDCGNRRRASSGKRVKHGIANEAEHANQSVSECFGIRCRMMTCRCAGQAGPDLQKPLLVVVMQK